MISICDDLRKSVLQAAIQGRLTKQLPEDGDAEDLYKEIQTEKQRLIREGKIKKEKPLPEIPDEEIPFDIPESWKWVRFGSICSKLTDGSHNPPPKTASGYRVISAKNIKNGKIEFTDDDRFSSEVDFERENKRTRITKGDLILGIIGGSIGNTAIYNHEEKVIAQRSIAIISAIIPSLYVLIFLNSGFSQNFFSDESNGSAQGGIYLGKLNSMLFPLPPLAEQKRIVARVDELMKRIDEMEKTEKDITALYDAFPGDMKAALLQAAIQGKLTEQLASDGDAETLYAEIQAEKQKLIKEGKIKKEKPLPEISEDDIPFDIPENWKWVRFGDCFDYHIGKTPPRKEPVYWKEEFPWVSIADMIDGDITQRTKEKVSDYAVSSTFSNRVSPAGTLIMSFKLTVGKVSILGMNAVHNEAIISIYPILNIDNIMRNYLFKILPFVANAGDTKNAIKGKTLNSESISNLLVPLPPLTEQKRIVEKLDQLLPICDSMKEAIDA